MLAVGTAQNATSSDAGRFATKVANESISEEESPQWALAFVGGRHDPDKILDGLRTELGDIPIRGGSAVGTITHQSLSYTLTPVSEQPVDRILLTEDNPVNQEIMSAMLAIGGYTYDCVSNGMEAVEAITKDDYDLVLMDCEMPEMDGFEATRVIREAEAATPAYQPQMEHARGRRAKIPIIALTAHAMQGYREQCLAAGMDDYLSKPCRTEELLSTLKKWLPVNTGGE